MVYDKPINKKNLILKEEIDMAVLKVTEASYKAEVEEAKVPVLIDFFADWCMPCKMFAPILDEVASAYDGKVKVVKINIDEAPELAQKFFVMSIPTLKLIDQGDVKATNVGAMSKAELEGWLLGHGVQL